MGRSYRLAVCAWRQSPTYPVQRSNRHLGTKNAGFEIVPLCCVKSDLPSGRVVGTRPGAGKQIPEGSEVLYEMSAGPTRWPTWVVVLVAVAAAAVLAIAWLAVPKRPRIVVRLPAKSTAAVDWGDPIAPTIEVPPPVVTSRVELPPYKERGT